MLLKAKTKSVQNSKKKQKKMAAENGENIRIEIVKNESLQVEMNRQTFFFL